MKPVEVGDIWLHTIAEFHGDDMQWAKREVLILEINDAGYGKERVEMLVLATGKLVDCYREYMKDSEFVT